jgi:hypothetical protein
VAAQSLSGGTSTVTHSSVAGLQAMSTAPDMSILSGYTTPIRGVLDDIALPDHWVSEQTDVIPAGWASNGSTTLDR